MTDYTTICTIRHAETDYATQKRYAGTLDVPLGKAGMDDAKRASYKLTGMHFDAIITSTLQRSIQTATLLFGDDAKFIQCEYCNERNYGKMQGLTEHEVSLLEPRVEFVKVGNDYHSLNPPNGETFQMLRRRAEKLRQLILGKYRGLTVLVVSHGVFLQQFHGLLRGLNWTQSLATYARNLEFTTFRFRGTVLDSDTAFQLVERDQINW